MKIPRQCGIYEIRNTVTGKRYIAGSVHLNVRIPQQKRRSVLINKEIRADWEKHGNESFIFKILFYCEKRDLLFFKRRAMDVYRTIVPSGYNMREDAFNIKLQKELGIDRIMKMESEKKINITVPVVEAKFTIYRRAGADLYSEGIYESVRDAMDDYERRLEQRQLKSGIKNMYFLVDLSQFAACAIKLNPIDFKQYKKERDRK